MHSFIHSWTFVPYQKANVMKESAIKVQLNPNRDDETEVENLVLLSRYLYRKFRAIFIGMVL